MSTLLLREAELNGALVDVRIEGETVVGIAPAGAGGPASAEVPCAGGALLPGLHDHHLHLLAMAAALASVDVSRHLAHAITTAHAQRPPGEWLRGVGYDESAAGPLDRRVLDALAPDRPVRVQHGSGAAWVLNSVALRQVGALTSDEAGLERDGDGHLTGRLFRLDGWLHDRLPPAPPPDLAPVGRRLASYGVTGVTDCTPTDSRSYLDTLARARHSGALPLTVAITGGPELSEISVPEGLQLGPVKIVIADHELPDLAELEHWIHRAHQATRPVAVHCVTREALVLALAAWATVGSLPGDRLEHASVTPSELIATIADRGITVVTQPAFVVARGDTYLREVAPEDRDDLYRCGSLLDGGVEVGGSTDAPFGPDDPWDALRAAVDRRAASGQPVGLDRGLSPAAALGLFLAPLDRPGGPARQVVVGAPADLCLLAVPLRQCLRDPSSELVAATVAGGAITYRR